jgi:hypothetical protein
MKFWHKADIRSTLEHVCFRADRKKTKRRQKKDAALLHRFKTQDADRARAAAALVAAARSTAETRALAMGLKQEERKNRRRRK